MTDDDRKLGMDCPISRRDFLDGVAIGLGGALLTPQVVHAAAAAAAQVPAVDYPPALTGLRGNHTGSFEAFHSLRDGQFWKSAAAPVPTNEEYDLIVVGAGISGLAAAHYYRKSRPGARILRIRPGKVEECNRKEIGADLCARPPDDPGNSGTAGTVSVAGPLAMEPRR